MKRICHVLFSFVLYGLLSGSYFVSCSSGSDDDFIDSGFNSAPVARDFSLITTVDTPISSVLQATDRDGDDLTYQLVSNPRLGILQVFNPTSGAFTYLSNSNGVDSFTFRANDGRSNSAAATVTITVNRGLLSWKRLVASTLESTQSLSVLLETTGVTTPPMDTVQMKWWTENLQLQSDETPLLATDPFNPNRGLAYIQGHGLYTSQDGGISWTLAQTQAWFVNAESTVSIITFSEFVPGLVYGVVNTPLGGHRLGRSLDGGATWQPLNDSHQGPLLELVSGPLRPDNSLLLYGRMIHKEAVYQAVDYPY
jgi:hypothetical protein